MAEKIVITYPDKTEKLPEDLELLFDQVQSYSYTKNQANKLIKSIESLESSLSKLDTYTRHMLIKTSLYSDILLLGVSQSPSFLERDLIKTQLGKSKDKYQSNFLSYTYKHISADIRQLIQNRKYKKNLFMSGETKGEIVMLRKKASLLYPWLKRFDSLSEEELALWFKPHISRMIINIQDSVNLFLNHSSATPAKAQTKLYNVKPQVEVGSNSGLSDAAKEQARKALKSLKKLD